VAELRASRVRVQSDFSATFKTKIADTELQRAHTMPAISGRDM